MKLYTEEQVSKIIFKTKQWSNLSDDYLIATVIPIELPSDEDMEKKAESFYPISKEYKEKYKTDYNDFNTCWREGAKWMKEQMLNQNK